MPDSISDKEFLETLEAARSGKAKMHPSPEDWREHWIYEVMVDRFNNPSAPPKYQPFDAPYGSYQGGSFKGIQEKISYLKKLGVTALWLSPVLKNCQYDENSYHGYGIQNFLAAEPRFASDPSRADDELRELVDAAHSQGIYVILDIVFHHAGNVFAYVKGDGGKGGKLEYLNDAPWSDQPKEIRWRDEHGNPNPDWAEAPVDAHPDAAVMPLELRRNDLFVRKGTHNNDERPEADFYSFKSLNGELAEGDMSFPLSAIMAQAYKYVIARFDVDGFRIDTLKFMSQRFERDFACEIREFAASIGKHNFFLFGEVWDDEQTISRFLRSGGDESNDPIGVDAVQDYPLFGALPAALKGMDKTPQDIARVFQERGTIESANVDEACDLTRCYVTFLDNHDVSSRFGYTGDRQDLDQIVVGLTCLFCLAGIPSVYYGTEQGLQGHKTSENKDDSNLREALWGKENAFDESHPLYQEIAALGKLRSDQPALIRGGQFIRPISSDGEGFGISAQSPGVLVFSRVWEGQEVICAANLNGEVQFEGFTILDGNLHQPGAAFQLLYSNKTDAAKFAAPKVEDRARGEITIYELNSGETDGPARVLPLKLKPMEVQVLKQA